MFSIVTLSRFPMSGSRGGIYQHAESNRRAEGGEGKTAQQFGGGRVSKQI